MVTIDRWIRTPKGNVTAAMLAFLIFASIAAHSVHGIIEITVAVATAVIVDVILNRWIVSKKSHIPDSAMITGLIIGLILSSTSPWYIVIITSILAIFSKYLFVYQKKPIFNPAAMGLLVSAVLMQSQQSWWGAFGDLPGWTVAFLLVAGYIVTNRVQKFPLVFSYLGTYLLLLLGMGIFQIGDAVDALRPPFINAAIFFAFFMLTDPPTTPVNEKEQIIVGILSAAVGVIFYSLFGGLAYLFIGIAVGSLYHVVRKSQNRKIALPQ